MRQIEPVAKPLPTASSSAAIMNVGNIHAEAPTIYIRERAIDHVIDYFQTNLEQELGGFLLGGLHKDRKVYVEVRDFLPATDTKSHAVSLTFTHKTWSMLTRQVEERFPKELVLGWAHTHPSLGIFLSSYDVFIHKHFFSQPWHIAMVVDPVKRKMGFFQWQQGKVASCGFICVR